MEMPLTQTFIFCGICLLISLARPSKSQRPTALFKLYLSGTVIIGLAIVSATAAERLLVDTVGRILGVAIVAWLAVSALAAFTAPRKWSVIPILYIVFFGALLSVQFISTPPDNYDAFIAAWGITTILSAIVGHLLLYPRREARLVSSIARENRQPEPADATHQSSAPDQSDIKRLRPAAEAKVNPVSIKFKPGSTDLQADGEGQKIFSNND